MIFYDFEVFKHDWMVVLIDMDRQKITEIVNDVKQLEYAYTVCRNDIWVGFNSRHYDQYILKGILCGFNPKEINDYIIKDGGAGWMFSNLLRRFPLNNFDVMQGIDRGLKTFEGFMGNDIKESGVPFDIDRKLTFEEIQETLKYCRHDVEQTIEVFLKRKEDFDAQISLMKMFNRPLSDINRTKVQLSALILEASKQNYTDEFEISFPETMKIEKYKEVVEWYENPKNRKYYVDPFDEKSNKMQLEVMIAGVPHVFGWGGVHGARESYSGEGYFLNMDVGSLYPALMCEYDLMSRSVPRKGFDRFKEIKRLRLELKHAGKKAEQAPLKIVLNGTYGAMKDKNNSLYDPLQANNVCVYGQLLLLDLIEKLEPHCTIIQSNTDGVLVKLNKYEDFELIDEICYEWEKRTRLDLEFDEYVKVFQKDVNNYIIVDQFGKHKSKGAYVKKLSDLDYDLPIVNKALIDYMVKGIPIEKTIEECDSLKEFQQVKKISMKYTCLIHGNKKLNEKCVRVFASTRLSDGGLTKVHAETGTCAKVESTPEHCFLMNDEVNSVSVPSILDKRWYIDLAYKRLEGFGVK